MAGVGVFVVAAGIVEEGEEADDLALALSQGRRRDMAAGRTLVGPHRTDLQAVYRAKAQPADQCSTGEQKALLISLILANARALAQDLGQPPVLLFDEVAAHLDAARRGALYDEICSLGAQAISLFDPETVLFVDNHQPQLLELNTFFNECVRSHHGVYLTPQQGLAYSFLFFFCGGPHQLLAAYAHGCKQRRQLAVMLFCQNFCGCHEGCLKTGAHRLCAGQSCHHGFSTACR
jgi:hypothetical protein